MELTSQRGVDELGRVVLPIEMRQALSLGDRAKLNLRLEGKKIILENAAACCTLCHSGEGPMARSGGDLFCPACLARVKAL